MVRAFDEELSKIGEPNDFIKVVYDIPKILSDAKITHKIFDDPLKESYSYPNLMSLYSRHVVEINMEKMDINEFQTFEMKSTGVQYTKWHWLDLNEAMKLNSTIKMFYDSK